MNKFLKILLLVIIVLAGATGLGIYWTFYRTLPDYNATHSLEGLNSEVQIHWDYYGVPHIYADNRHDLYFSLGYVHAQDRLWQMTLTQMAAEGRLAEFLGKDLVQADLFQRTIGLWKTAEQIEAQLSDSTRRVLESYADGVNRYVSTHPNELPLEFSLVDMEPIEWTVTHSIALARLIAWELNISWKNETALAYLSQHLSPQQYQELLPGNPFLSDHDPSLTPDKQSAQSLLRLLEGDQVLRRVLKADGFGTGSNGWAVSAEKSSTDYPLLAGDPHLALHMPGKWYEAHLNLNGRNLSGATLAGAPIVVIGQNEVFGWTLTNLMLDDTDFFLERLHPTDSTRYLVDSLDGQPVYENFTIQRELIKVKNADDTTFTRRLTKHGPVISQIYPDRSMIGDSVITMKWTAHDPSFEVDALLGINWARSFEEFRRHLRDFKSPAQNFVYADTAGNIARIAAGAVPVRGGSPVQFRNGWNPENDWQGYLPFDQLPRSVNPESGWVANANNPVETENNSYISVYWEPASRYNRIAQYLIQNESLSVPAFQAMQLDTYSRYARDMTQMILPVLRESDRNFDTAIQYLENWDYQYEPSETAASIMDVFILQLYENIFKDEFGEPAYSNFLQFSGLPSRILMRSMQQGSSFFDEVTTDTVETREDVIVYSMMETIDYLSSELGSEPYEWRWENIHTITLKPQLFGEAVEQPDANGTLKLIVENLMNRGPYAARGHKMSINNGSYSWNDPYEMNVGPSIRRIVDLSNMSRTLSITPTGQSGLMLSEYYGDQTESWLNGQYKFVYQDSTLFEETVYRTMLLQPEQ